MGEAETEAAPDLSLEVIPREVPGGLPIPGCTDLVREYTDPSSTETPRHKISLSLPLALRWPLHRSMLQINKDVLRGACECKTTEHSGQLQDKLSHTQA